MVCHHRNLIFWADLHQLLLSPREVNILQQQERVPCVQFRKWMRPPIFQISTTITIRTRRKNNRWWKNSYSNWTSGNHSSHNRWQHSPKDAISPCWTQTLPTIARRVSLWILTNQMTVLMAIENIRRRSKDRAPCIKEQHPWATSMIAANPNQTWKFTKAIFRRRRDPSPCSRMCLWVSI